MDNRNEFIYERLLRHPLFQGMSQNGLTSLVGHTKLEFVRQLSSEISLIEFLRKSVGINTSARAYF